MNITTAFKMSWTCRPHVGKLPREKVMIEIQVWQRQREGSELKCIKGSEVDVRKLINRSDSYCKWKWSINHKRVNARIEL